MGADVDWHRSWIRHVKELHSVSNIAIAMRTNKPTRLMVQKNKQLI